MTEFYLATKRMKFCHSQVNGWNWRTSSLAKLARLRRPKIACSPSSVDYRPKTNAAILLDTVHTKGRPSTAGIQQGKETKKLECG
jgi:hypothetical protein